MTQNASRSASTRQISFLASGRLRAEPVVAVAADCDCSCSNRVAIALASERAAAEC
jgi:hypothetical protein